MLWGSASRHGLLDTVKKHMVILIMYYVGVLLPGEKRKREQRTPQEIGPYASGRLFTCVEVLACARAPRFRQVQKSREGNPPKKHPPKQKQLAQTVWANSFCLFSACFKGKGGRICTKCPEIACANCAFFFRFDYTYTYTFTCVWN